ncbi:HAMP domain-containing histidine kinase [Psychrobacillus sp. NPDC093200]|uniref:HAMP domain-containing sensor histidine kinase n=2 Tax=unclassified Psychrobacillus TaxID=2636677 RepID=UPI0011A4D386
MIKWTLQKKWTYSAALSIFLSFLMMCIILYFSIFSWMLMSEKKVAQNTLNEVVSFFESQGPVISVQDIQRNRTLINQLVNQEQSVRILNEDGIELLRINDASPFKEFSASTIEEFKKDEVNGQPIYLKSAQLDFGLFKGYIEISHSLANFKELMQYIKLAMIIFALIALILSAFIGYSLSAFLLKPIKELRDEMQLAKDTRFSKEVNFEKISNDEIGELMKIYKELMNEVNETISRQDEFIHNVSHELRTPIQVVEGHLALLNRWGKEEREVLDESLDISLLEVQKMKTLIEEMLKLAKNERTIQEARTSVFLVVKELEQKFQVLSPEASIVYQGSESIVVNMPNTTLEQILRNLIENAIKYNEKKPSIIIEAKEESDETVIIVSDNGVGITEESLPRIFDRFYTADEARTKTKGGSGLGLSIVQRLVGAYKGNIQVQSNSNGSNFLLFFPKFTSE